MTQTRNMKPQSLEKVIIMLLTIFLYFVSFCGNMILNLHFTAKIKNAKTSAEPMKFEQILPQKSYSLSREGDFVVDKSEIVFPTIKFLYDGKIYVANKFENLSTLQKQIIKQGFKKRVEIMKFANQNGFSIEDSVKYAFPEIDSTVRKLQDIVYKNCENAVLTVQKNTAKSIIKPSKNGVKLDEQQLYVDIFDCFAVCKNEYVFNVVTKNIIPDISEKEIEKINKVRSEFKTSFKTSSDSRKNNIKLALERFDGVILLPGETLSFNNKTGLRSQENGYQKAKIIKNGMFEDEFGGGVCQVSSTLYNAFLLADLEVLQASSHSLPVSYVMSGFDAMVNSGSSDLVVKNNQNFPVMIATSSVGDECKVVIYGSEKTQKIVRKFEKISENLHFSTIYTSNNEVYGKDEVCDDQEVVLSYGKPGYTVKSWLEYYEDDVLIKTKNLRTSIYNPTKQVVLVSKNDPRLS